MSMNMAVHGQYMYKAIPLVQATHIRLIYGLVQKGISFCVCDQLFIVLDVGERSHGTIDAYLMYDSVVAHYDA